MSWYNEWWVWTVVALVLGIAEILIPAWIFFGFALGALFFGVTIWTGISAGMSLARSLVVFAVFSLIAYFILCQIFGVRRGQVKIWHKDIND